MKTDEAISKRSEADWLKTGLSSRKIPPDLWHLLKWAVAFCAILFCAAEGKATTYKVGEDEDYPDLFAVVGLVAPGDIVEVDGDSTYTGGIVFNTDGTTENPIVIRGIRVNGQRPVLAQTNGFSGTGGDVVHFAGSHYVFEGFDVTLGDDPNGVNGISSDGDDITIRDCAVHDSVGGIYSSDRAGSLTLQYVEVYHCGTSSTAHQIYAGSDNTAYPSAVFHMAFCYLHDANGGDNVKSRVARTEVYYNWIEGAAYHELDLVGANPATQAPGAAGRVREDGDIVGNIIVKSATTQGLVANVGGDDVGWSNGRYRFVNNTIVLPDSTAGNSVAFQLKNAVQTFETYNNVFYRFGGKPISILSSSRLFADSTAAIVGANNWVPQGSISIPPTWTNTLTGLDPQVRDPNAFDFTPLAGGMLFDTGATVTPSPSGLDFPSPLVVPLFNPPNRAPLNPGAEIARATNGVSDIGALETPIAAQDYTLPVATDDVVQIPNHLPLTIPVLANDSTMGNTPLAIMWAGGAGAGSVAISGSNIIYTPGMSFTGSDSFSYSVSDGYGVATANVSISYPNPTTYKVGSAQAYPDLLTVAPLLLPGDTVEVDGDATYAGGVTFKNSGTPTAKITVRGIRVNGRRPVLAGTSGFNGVGGAIMRMWGSHYVIEGFDLTPAGDLKAGRGFYNVADDIILRDSIIHDCPFTGISGSDASGSLRLEYVEVHHCGKGDRAHQIYVGSNNTLYPNAVFHMEFCYVHDGTGGNNVKSRVGRSEIYYNWIEGAAFYDLDLDGADPNDQLPGTASLVREDGDIVGNVLIAGGYIIANIGGDNTGVSNGRYRFVNNTFIQGSGLPSIQLKNAVQSFEMHNNVLYRRGGGPLIVYTTKSLRPGYTISGSHNWVPAKTAVPVAWTDTVVGGGPCLRNVDSFDFTPLAGGPLTDAGAQATHSPNGLPFISPLALPLYQPPNRTLPIAQTAAARPVNGSIDIGAFELTGNNNSSYTLPTAANDTVGITAKTSIGIPVLANDFSFNGQALTITTVTQGSCGSATITGSNVIYTPAKNFVYSDTFTYSVTDGYGVATATVTIVNPFNALIGSYEGLISNSTPTNDNSGSIVMTTNWSGSFSCTLRYAGYTKAFKGQFDVNGSYFSVLSLSNGTTLTVALNLALKNGVGKLSGTVSNGTDVSVVDAVPHLYSNKNPAPLIGTYTVIIMPDATNPASPQGISYGVLRVKSDGSATVAGVLADKQPLSAGANLRSDNSLPFYSTFYGIPGSAFGTLTFRNIEAISDLDGTIAWFKPTQATAAKTFYHAGFAVTLNAIGSRYNMPVNSAVLSVTNSTPNGQFEAAPDDPLLGLTKNVTLLSDNSVSIQNAGSDTLSIVIASPTAIFSGKYVLPIKARSPVVAGFSGVVFQKQNLCAGFVCGPSTTGPVQIQADN